MYDETERTLQFINGTFSAIHETSDRFRNDFPYYQFE